MSSEQKLCQRTDFTPSYISSSPGLEPPAYSADFELASFHKYMSQFLKMNLSLYVNICTHILLLLFLWRTLNNTVSLSHLLSQWISQYMSFSKNRSPPPGPHRNQSQTSDTNPNRSCGPQLFHSGWGKESIISGFCFSCDKKHLPIFCLEKQVLREHGPY